MAKKRAAKKVAKKKGAEIDVFDLDQFVAEVNDKYGEGSLLRASDANIKVGWLSTGCAAIDINCGGGIPESRITEIYGAESSGKTTLSLTTIAEFQKKYKKGLAVFIDVERTFDSAYAQRLGVNLKRLYIGNPDSGEQSIDLVSVCCSKEVPVFIVVDSIAAMTPTSEADSSASDQFVGAIPRLINKMMRIITSRMKRNIANADAPSTTVLVLNQVREKIGIMFGNPETTPGGKGKNFFAGLRLRLFSSEAKGNRIVEKITRQKVTRPILMGRKVTFTIIKNKCGGTPFEEGEYQYYIREYKGYPAFSYNNADTLFELGVFYGAIDLDEKRGFVYECDETDDADGYEIVFKAKHAFIKALIEEPDIQEDLRLDILNNLNDWNEGGDDDA